MMNPEQALELLNRVCSQVSVNREGHVQLQEAIRVLNEFVTTNQKSAKGK